MFKNLPIPGYPRGPAFAPDFGGIPDDTGDDNSLDGDSIPLSDAPESGDDDEISDDGESALGALFGRVEGEESEEGDDSEDGYPTVEEEQVTLLADMKAAIEGLSFDESLIPADFNPSDPKQLREVLAKSNRITMQNTIATVFKPIQAAMNRMQRNVDRQIEDSISNSNSNTSFESQLIASIPAAESELVRPMLTPLITAAKKRYPNDAKAQVNAIRKGMIAAGMNPKGIAGGPKARQRSASSVLDAFAPMPKAPTPAARARAKA